MTEAYERVMFRGKQSDRMTAQALTQMEERLGYELTIVQGSYNAGVGASAGTHDGGGAVDLLPYDWENKVRIGREIGFAMWHRSPFEGPWVEHVHGILIGNAKMSSGARSQVEAYRVGLNGLATRRSDTFNWRPNPVQPYRYVSDSVVLISLSALRVDFFNVLSGGTNLPSRRGRVVQRLLNRKNNAELGVDGVIGPITQKAWRDWERKVSTVGRAGVPDKETLRALFSWTIYYVKK